MKKNITIVMMLCICMWTCAEDVAEQKELPPFGENIPDGYTLVYEQDFSAENVLDEFEFSDPKTWRKGEEDGEHFLELFKGVGRYRPEVRSPRSIALCKNLEVSDFILEIDVESTDILNGAHRDACFFFNAVDPSHFYYVHIASKADPNAHNIFLVNGVPRTNIAEETTEGVKWGIGIRHRVRIERSCEDGKIRVFYDDMSAPIMETTDKHFGLGRIGFGSFDNTNRFYQLHLYAPEAVEVQEDFFK